VLSAPSPSQDGSAVCARLDRLNIVVRCASAHLITDGEERSHIVQFWSKAVNFNAWELSSFRRGMMDAQDRPERYVRYE